MKSKFQLLKCKGSQLLEQYSNQLVEYKHLYQSRKALLKLDDHILKDIGISKQQAEEEARKPFWESTDNDVRQNDSRRVCIQDSPLQKHVSRYLNKPVKSRGVSF